MSIELDPGKRWEEGTDHHPMSLALMKHIAKVDWEYCGGYFDWKTGGDGDNGETLMFEMDSFFEALDAQKGLNQVNSQEK